MTREAPIGSRWWTRGAPVGPSWWARGAPAGLHRWARAASALLLAGVPAGAAVAQEEPPPRPAGVTIQRFEGGSRLDAVLPGRLLGYALARRGVGLEPLLLVAPRVESPPDARAPSSPSGSDEPCERSQDRPAPSPPPRALYRLDVAGEGLLELLRDDLPPSVSALDALDLDGDGTDEILLGETGRLLVLRDDGARRAARGPDLLMEHPDLRPSPFNPWATPPADPSTIPASGDPTGARSAVLQVPGLGAVQYYAASSGGDAWDLVGEAVLPIGASRSGDLLKLSSPVPRVVGSGPDGTLVIAAGPETHGRRRLRCVLIEVPRAGPVRAREVWSRLPSVEQVIETTWLMIDGAPHMAVTTRRADKLSLLEEKLLRLFPMGTDRSRAGEDPLLAIETNANLWQRVVIRLRDVDGDGRADLVLGYWKGIKDDDVVLDVYRRRPDGLFDASARRTKLTFEDASRAVLEQGEDLDADGLADLLVVAGGSLRVLPGRASGDGASIVAPAPRWSLPLASVLVSLQEMEHDIELSLDGITVLTAPPAFGVPRVADIDGDGRPEVLLAGPYDKGLAAVEVFRLRPPGR